MGSKSMMRKSRGKYFDVSFTIQGTIEIFATTERKAGKAFEGIPCSELCRNASTLNQEIESIEEGVTEHV